MQARNTPDMYLLPLAIHTSPSTPPLPCTAPAMYHPCHPHPPCPHPDMHALPTHTLLPALASTPTERDIKAGEQVLHTYGDLSDAQLVQTYGFVDLGAGGDPGELRWQRQGNTDHDLHACGCGRRISCPCLQCQSLLRFFTSVNCLFIHRLLCMLLEGGFSQRDTHTALAGFPVCP